jgi:hypothetical protein
MKKYFLTSLMLVWGASQGFGAGCPDIPVGNIICKKAPDNDPSIQSVYGTDGNLHAVFPGVVNQIWAVPAGGHWYNFKEKAKCRPCLDSSNPANKEKTRCGSPLDRAQEFCAPYGGIDNINTPTYWGDTLMNAGSVALDTAAAINPAIAGAKSLTTKGLQTAGKVAQTVSTTASQLSNPNLTPEARQALVNNLQRIAQSTSLQNAAQNVLEVSNNQQSPTTPLDVNSQGSSLAQETNNPQQAITGQESSGIPQTSSI